MRDLENRSRRKGKGKELEELRSRWERVSVLQIFFELFFVLSIDEVTELREGGDVRGSPQQR